jgi:pSer/pThr/pTyr-binding forkhead associated (FHA) protein
MPVLRIGSGPDCHIRLTDPSLAAHHAEVRVDADGSWLVDRSRAPGTFVNGRRIRRHRLRDGDIIDLGAVRLRYRHAEDLKAKVAGFLREVLRPRAGDAAQVWPSAG